MGTRGCIAIKNGNSWEGIYNHSDSYPEELGVELYCHLKKFVNEPEKMQKFKERLLHFETWEDYLTDYYNYPFGDFKKSLQSDNSAVMTEKTELPLFIEWVYIIDVETKKIEVLASREIKKKSLYQWERIDEIDLLKNEIPNFEELSQKR
jgi:hypothetical protein